jgi:hypothetical protein
MSTLQQSFSVHPLDVYSKLVPFRGHVGTKFTGESMFVMLGFTMVTKVFFKQAGKVTFFANQQSGFVFFF